MDSIEAKRDERTYKTYLYKHDNFLGKWCARTDKTKQYHLLANSQEELRKMIDEREGGK